MSRFAFCLILSVFLAIPVFADPPAEIDYQGKVLISDVPFTGPGYFKFAIGDALSSTNFWTNDGTVTNEPSAAVTSAVYNGVFTVQIGDAAMMTAIDPDIFQNGQDLYLRVWFSTDNSTFNEMLPSQKLVSSPYAINADLLDGYDAAEIVSEATNRVTLSGDVSGTPGGGTTVDSLQGDALDTGTPASDEVLMWDGAAWTSAPITGVTGGLYVDETGDTMTGALIMNVGANNSIVIESSGTSIMVGNSATSTVGGVAAGWQARATDAGSALGYSADAHDQGAAVGYNANGNNLGAAVGYNSIAYSRGSVVGHTARAHYYGSAVGYQSEAHTNGAALGYNANGSLYGVAVGRNAQGYDNSVAVGAYANGLEEGAAVGYNSSAYSNGAAVGYQADGAFFGAAVGQSANGKQYGAALGYNSQGFGNAVGVGVSAMGGYYGVAVGYQAQGYSNAVAVGQQANADYAGIAIGAEADGSYTNIAIGLLADSRGGNERISIGHNVTNRLDGTMRVRGDLYMDGGMSLWGRTPFGSGPWQQLVPLPSLDHVVWVATNGTPGGPGTIDRPFDTPQNGYNAAAAMYTNGPAAVVIAAGNYGSGLVMGAGNIHVLGFSRPQLPDLAVIAPSRFIKGKQRVENIIVNGTAMVSLDGGSDVKFHNCRFASGLYILGPRVEVQDCYATGSDGPAVQVGAGTVPISEIAIYNSSIFNKDMANAALLVNDLVYYFEVIGCEIVNYETGGAPPWAAVEDNQVLALNPPQVPHLYSHNIIHGAEHGTWIGMTVPAVYDPFATNDTICFVQNTVWGDVGMSSNQQYYANNIVYGDINNTGFGMTWGWGQRGFGAGQDNAGNTEQQIMFPGFGGAKGLPAAWQD